MDCDEKLLQKAGKKGIRTKKVNLETDSFPFSRRMFDLIFCGEVIEHIYNTDFLLDQIKRVLRYDGDLISSTCNLASLTNRLLLLFGFQPGGSEVSLKHLVGNPFIKGKTSGHIRVFTLKALKNSEFWRKSSQCSHP
ncbi:MAG: methyltransferase domain-containing protein [Candidatus Aenigmarchaeota archaeon]|nr:methyltransferase domain-containing protein [Candidatus Aenigmarchaeota archaeon]